MADMELKQMHKGDRVSVRSDPRGIRFAEEQRRADLMNLSLLIRRYPDKAVEFMRKYVLTESQDVV